MSSRRRNNTWPQTKPPKNELKVLIKSLQGHITSLGEHHPQTAVVHNQIGNYYFRKGNLEAATASYEQAVSCEPGEHLATSFLNLGTCYWRSGDVLHAIYYLREALKVHHEVEGKSLEEAATPASVHHQLGLCYALSGDFDLAMDSLRKALKIRERFADKIEFGQTVDAIGKVHFMQGNYKAALACHKTALTHIAEGKGPTVNTLQNMAACYIARCRPEKALSVLQHVYSIQRSVLERASKSGEPAEKLSKALYETLHTMAGLHQQLGSADHAFSLREEAAIVCQEGFQQYLH